MISDIPPVQITENATDFQPMKHFIGRGNMNIEGINKEEVKHIF